MGTIDERYQSVVLDEGLPFKSHCTISSSNRETSAYRFGHPGGPKVVMIHGINTCCHSIGYIAKGLSDKCDIVTYVGQTSLRLTLEEGTWDERLTGLGFIWRRLIVQC